MRGVRRFIDLCAWQACDTYKKAIYKLIDAGVYGNYWKRRALHRHGAFVADGIPESATRREALRNARRARERRIASRPERLAKRTAKKESEPGTTNPEQRTEPEHEPRSENPEE